MAKQYKDHSGTSGVTRFESHADGITVWFGSKRYHYSHANAGADHVNTMKRLAHAGVGLAGYIRANAPQHDNR